MPAGFTYNLRPQEEKIERYDVKSGIRRIGAYKLDITNLPIGTRLASFTPIAADLKTKLSKVVRNVKVAEAYTSGATSLKVKKGSLVTVGMFLGNGSKGATVSAIDMTNSGYDILTISDLGEDLGIDIVLFEATATDGKTPKNIANSALYENVTIGNGINLIALLSAAREIEPDKLVIPFSDKDKEEIGNDFQFNE